jgi:aspartate/methionine/tyrosine aminotransferase
MTNLRPFKLERFFALHEFRARYLLSASDCESLTLAELLQMADRDALARWHSLRLGYTESQGDPVLRQAICQEYATLSPEDILVAVPEECIYIAMQVLTAPGDHVVAVAPAYQSLHEVAHSRGCEVTPWPARQAGDRWKFDLQDVERAVRPNTKLLVINFPHNPTGSLLTREELNGVVALARRHDLFVFSDEMYRGLEYNGAARLPAVCDLYEKGISLAGLSKSHAVPGLRLGWLAARQPELIQRSLAYKDYTTICHSAPSEVLGLMALRASPAILERNLEIINTNLSLAEQFFARHAARLTWIRPSAGPVAFASVDGSSSQMSQRLLDEQGVMLLPGPMFDAPDAYFRLGLGRRNFGEALERWHRIL